MEEIKEAIKNKKYLIANRDKNMNTFVELGFDKEDVANELFSLEIKHYAYDLPDEKDLDAENYKVFCKFIQNKDIYIKLKIKKAKTKILFCMSFHIAEYKIEKLPYS
ncbi:type II toxin-antitoxin system MqsR family toxin [Cetobacterium sp.]|uniref:type II toxin-antitoxin system MqsR family toxin n=1 Tax=Cetobacterium sp. TaxID=2071632 RepID=UPI003F2F3443